MAARIPKAGQTGSKLALAGFRDWANPEFSPGSVSAASFEALKYRVLSMECMNHFEVLLSLGLFDGAFQHANPSDCGGRNRGFKMPVGPGSSLCCK